MVIGYYNYRIRQHVYDKEAYLHLDPTRPKCVVKLIPVLQWTAEDEEATTLTNGQNTVWVTPALDGPNGDVVTKLYRYHGVAFTFMQMGSIGRFSFISLIN